MEERILKAMTERPVRIDVEGASFEGDFFQIHGEWIEIQDERRVRQTFVRMDRIVAVTILPKPGSGSPYRFQIPPDGFDVEAFERELIVQAMEKSEWVIARASKLLGLTYRTLQYRLEKFGLKRPEDP